MNYYRSRYIINLLLIGLIQDVKKDFNTYIYDIMNK